MTWNWKTYLIAGAGIVLLLMLFFAVNAAIGNAEDKAKMEATLAQQAEFIKKQTEKINELGDNIKQRDSELRRTLDDLDATRRRAQTPTQIIREIPQVLPPTAQPRLEETEGQPARLVFEGDEKIKGLFDELLAGKQAKIELAARNQDIADMKAIIAAKDEQIAAVEKQRDAAIVAARGGTKWSRFRKAVKNVGIGIAIGAGLVVALGG